MSVHFSKLIEASNTLQQLTHDETYQPQPLCTGIYFYIDPTAIYKCAFVFRLRYVIDMGNSSSQSTLPSHLTNGKKPLTTETVNRADGKSEGLER